MSGGAQAPNDWGEGAAPENASTVTFTQHHALVAVTLTQHVQDCQLDHVGVTRGEWQVSAVPRRRPPRLTAHRPAWRILREEP